MFICKSFVDIVLILGRLLLLIGSRFCKPQTFCTYVAEMLSCLSYRSHPSCRLSLFPAPPHHAMPLARIALPDSWVQVAPSAASHPFP